MSAASVRELLDRLSVSPVRLRALLGSISETALRTSPTTGGFAPIEDAWHLRDIEAEGHYVRIRRILAEERPVLASIDGEQLALARRYVERELSTALDEFAQFREASLDLLGGLSEEAWSRSAEFEGNPVTLRELVMAIAAHDESHLATLAAALAGAGSARNTQHGLAPESPEVAAVRGAAQR